MELHHHEKSSCQGSVGNSPFYLPCLLSLSKKINSFQQNESHLRTANINASNRKQAKFETTLTANKRGLKTTLFADETTFAANKPHSLQIGYKPYITIISAVTFTKLSKLYELFLQTHMYAIRGLIYIVSV